MGTSKKHEDSMMEEDRIGWMIVPIEVGGENTTQDFVNKLLDKRRLVGADGLIVDLTLRDNQHKDAIEALVLFQEIYPSERLSKIEILKNRDAELGAWYKERAIEAFDFKHHIARPIQDDTEPLHAKRVTEWEACGISHNSANKLTVLCSLIIESMPEAGEVMTKQRYERTRVLEGIYQDVFASEEFNPVRNSMEDPGIPEYANAMLSELMERWLQYEGESKEASGKDRLEGMSKHAADIFSKARDQIKEVVEEFKAVFLETADSTEATETDAASAHEEIKAIEEKILNVVFWTNKQIESKTLQQLLERIGQLNNLFLDYREALGDRMCPFRVQRKVRELSAHTCELEDRVITMSDRGARETKDEIKEAMEEFLEEPLQGMASADSLKDNLERAIEEDLESGGAYPFFLRQEDSPATPNPTPISEDVQAWLQLGYSQDGATTYAALFKLLEEQMPEIPTSLTASEYILLDTYIALITAKLSTDEALGGFKFGLFGYNHGHVLEKGAKDYIPEYAMSIVNRWGICWKHYWNNRSRRTMKFETISRRIGIPPHLWQKFDWGEMKEVNRLLKLWMAYERVPEGLSEEEEAEWFYNEVKNTKAGKEQITQNQAIPGLITAEEARESAGKATPLEDLFRTEAAIYTAVRTGGKYMLSLPLHTEAVKSLESRGFQVKNLVNNPMLGRLATQISWRKEDDSQEAVEKSVIGTFMDKVSTQEPDPIKPVAGKRWIGDVAALGNALNTSNVRNNPAKQRATIDWVRSVCNVSGQSGQSSIKIEVELSDEDVKQLTEDGYRLTWRASDGALLGRVWKIEWGLWGGESGTVVYEEGE